MSVYAVAECDVCGDINRYPVNHPSESSYWTQSGGRRPVGWEYHMSHDGDSAKSVLFCKLCEAKVIAASEEKAKEMIHG